MNFLKPTKPKVLGTIAVYFAGVMGGWITAGLTSLFFPNLISELMQEATDLQERVRDISLVAALGMSAIHFVIGIIATYIGVCFVVYLLRRYESKSNVAS